MSSRFTTFGTCHTGSLRGQVAVEVDGEGGLAGSDETAGTIAGNCANAKHKGSTKCARKPEITHTPMVVAVEPRIARAGEVITVFGRTCISDTWKADPDVPAYLK